MAGDASRSLMTVALVVGCLLLANASPGFSSPVGSDGGVFVAAGPVRHVIRNGETLNILAKRYGVPAAAILKANPGLNPSRLALGKEIIIPMGGAASPAPAAATAPAAPAAPSSAVELRPEKAPQATQPLTGGPVGHDLADSPSAAPAAQPKTPDRTSTVQGVKATAATPTEAPVVAKPLAVEDSRADKAGSPVAASPQGVPNCATDLSFASGVAVVVLALALWLLRGIYGNLAAGWSLRALRLFRLGDSIRVAGYEGRVIARGWFYVTLRTPDNARIFVPNTRLRREIVAVLPSSRDDMEI